MFRVFIAAILAYCLSASPLMAQDEQCEEDCDAAYGICSTGAGGIPPAAPPPPPPFPQNPCGQPPAIPGGDHETNPTGWYNYNLANERHKGCIVGYNVALTAYNDAVIAYIEAYEQYKIALAAYNAKRTADLRTCFRAYDTCIEGCAE